MTTRILYNEGEPLTFPNGDPMQGMELTFTLVGAVSGKKVPAFSLPANTMVIGEVKVLTNALGEFSVELTPNDIINPATMYKCVVEGLGTFKGVVESGLTPKRFVDFFT